MTGSHSPPSGRTARAQTSGTWAQWLLVLVGGVFFCSAVLITAGVPGVPVGGPSDDYDALTPSPETTGTPTASTATSTGSAAVTASPTAEATPTPPTTVTATATPEASGTPVYRVNVGGPRLPIVGGPTWEADTADNPSPYLNVNESNTIATDTPDEIRLEPNVPSATPDAMFSTYRLERGSDTEEYEEMVWRFPVEPNREYEVRLYVVEAFFTLGDEGREYEQSYDRGGPRTFGVAINNETVLEDYEPFVEHGHDVGAMKAFEVTTEDGVVTIRFRREVENPTVSGIEIIDTGPRNNQSD